MYNIERLLKCSVQRHLSDDELGAYHDHVVDEVSRARIEVHLGRCQLCERRYAMMREVLATYTQELLTEADVKWLQRLLGQEAEDRRFKTAIEDARTLLQRLRDLLQEALAGFVLPVLEGARGAGINDDEGQEFQTEDGSIRGYAVKEDSGAFVIYLESDHTEYVVQGTLLLKTDGFQKPFIFERVTEDLVESEITLTPEELEKLPEEPVWTIEPRGKDNEPSKV